MDPALDRTAARTRGAQRVWKLWHQRPYVVAALVGSIVAFVLITYRVNLPATLESRSHHVGVATAIVLVDAPRSLSVDASGGNGIQVLSFRAKILADLAMKPVIMDTLAGRIGVPPELVVADPPAAAAAVGGAAVSVDDRRAHVVRAEVLRLDGGDNPIVTISTRASTPATAARLADAVVAALNDHLATAGRDDGTPTWRRIRLTQLSAGDATTLQRGPQPALTAGVVIAAFALACWLITAMPGLVARWRQVPRAIGA